MLAYLADSVADGSRVDDPDAVGLCGGCDSGRDGRSAAMDGG